MCEKIRHVTSKQLVRYWNLNFVSILVVLEGRESITRSWLTDALRIKLKIMLQLFDEIGHIETDLPTIPEQLSESSKASKWILLVIGFKRSVGNLTPFTGFRNLTFILGPILNLGRKKKHILEIRFCDQTFRTHNVRNFETVLTLIYEDYFGDVPDNKKITVRTQALKIVVIYEWFNLTIF